MGAIILRIREISTASSYMISATISQNYQLHHHSNLSLPPPFSKTFSYWAKFEMDAARGPGRIATRGFKKRKKNWAINFLLYLILCIVFYSLIWMLGLSNKIIWIIQSQKNVHPWLTQWNLMNRRLRPDCSRHMYGKERRLISINQAHWIRSISGQGQNLGVSSPFQHFCKESHLLKN